MKIDITQEDLDALTRHMKFAVSRYETESCALLSVADDYVGAKQRAVVWLKELDDASMLLYKLLHI